MDIINEIVIIGGGLSIRPQIETLKPILASKCTILINYSFKFFEGTFLCFQDRDFYVPDYAKSNEYKIRYPDFYNELKKLPLIIGLQQNNGLEEFILPNTIMIPDSKIKIYPCPLTGLFALILAELLQPKRIYLLGFDWTVRDKATTNPMTYTPESNLETHYYGNEIKHRGIGLVGLYENHDPHNYFKYFQNSKSKIYNVSPKSNIETFDKIDYPTFYSLLSSQEINQEQIRLDIKEQIKIQYL